MKPKLAIVTQSLAGGGGVSSMVCCLLQGLQEAGRFELSLITLALSSKDDLSVLIHRPQTWFKGVRTARDIFNGTPSLRMGAFAGDLEFQRYRPRQILTETLSGYDLIQFVVGSPQWAYCAAKVQRPRLLWTATTVRDDRRSQIHRAPLLRKYWMLTMTAIVERYERKALGQMDEVFALSRYTLNKVQPFIRNGLGRLAIAGVDTRAFAPAKDSSGQYFVCVGRLDDPRKNIELLVRSYHAFRRLVIAPPPLWLVGPEPPRKIRDLIARLQLGDFVRIIGPKTPDQLPEIYQNALAFVLSSDEEGLGIVLQEAMSCGLPVISTACGGPETIIENGNNGLLVPVGDGDELAGAMAKMINEPDLRHRMGQSALHRARTEFSIEAATRPFLAAYDRALKS